MGLMRVFITEAKMKKTKSFEAGDFVRITGGTHDDDMPPSRMGHILSEYKTIVHYTDTQPVNTGLWRVFMTNGKVLHLHEMFLEHAHTSGGHDEGR